MRTVITGASVLAIAAASLLATRPARACGGCFSPPRQVTVVTGHRMAFSISPQQSVLWDQIQYSGSPQDFAWVLPVRAGSRVELSHDEFFSALDALTNPVITGPASSCGTGGGIGCGSSSFAAAGLAESPNGGVQVISQGVVGPYDTVTVRSTNPTALYDWLLANQYDVPSTTRPTIDAYVHEGFDFIALRLAPGQGVQAMKPVRVVMPGASLSLPLRMVAAGAGANVGIVLYVISDGRYQAKNFPNGVVDESKLVWLHAQNQSNYQPLAAQTMQSNGGRTWLTEFAQVTSLLDTPLNVAASGSYTCGRSPGTGAGVSYYGINGLSLAGAYYAQCECLGPVQCTHSLRGEFGASLDASLDALLEGAADGPAEASDDAALDSAAPEDAALLDSTAPDAPEDGSAAPEAGGRPDGGGPTAEAGCDTNVCAGFDDLSVASVGLDPNHTWVTRMRAILPASALTEGDLVLEAAPSQQPVLNQHTVSVYDDPTYNPCPNSGGCAAADQNPAITGRALVAGALAFLGAALVRRRRRSSSARS